MVEEARHNQRSAAWGGKFGIHLDLIRIKRATSYFNTHNMDNALIDAEAAAKLKRNSTKPLVLMAAINIKKADYDAALTQLHRARSIDRKNPIILFQIGSIYYKEEDTRYIKYFNILFDIVKNNKDNPQKYYKQCY